MNLDDINKKQGQILKLLYGTKLGDHRSVLQWAVVIGILLIVLTFTSRLIAIVVLILIVLVALAWHFGWFSSLL